MLHHAGPQVCLGSWGRSAITRSSSKAGYRLSTGNVTCGVTIIVNPPTPDAGVAGPTGHGPRALQRREVVWRGAAVRA